MSADNYFHHFPNMILSHRFFNNGEWGFWNSYIYGGMDFTASAHNFIFYPLNWLIFSFPEKYFFILMTLRMFLEVWLIGIFSYLFFKEELHDDQWALFSSTVYQLGGFTLFGLLVYSSLTINLLFIIALYLIFTLHQRKCWLSYIFLTLAIFGLITSFNLGYFLATSISLLIIAAYRFSSFLKNTPEKRMYLYTLMASVVTGVLLGMVRLFPFLHGLMTEGTRMHATELQTTPGGIYLALTAFVPELMGIQISNAVHLLGNVTGHTGWHPQDNTYFYFGTLPVLLLCWACTRIKKIQAPFWFLSWAIASLWFLRIPPVSNVLDFAVFPFFHIAIPKMMIPISFCVLMGHAAKSLEADPRQFDRKSTISLAVILGLVGITILNFYGRTFPAVAGYYRVILPGAAFLAAAIFALKRFKPALLKKGLAPALFALMTGGIFILLHSVSLTGNESFRLSIRCSSFLISLLSGILLYHQIKSNQTTNKKRFLCYAAFLILAGLFMAVPFKAVGLFGALGFRALTAVLGVVRFMIIAGFFLYFMHHVQSGKMSPNRLFYFFI
ncbi:MAG TPA: hypothetical protein VLJ10_04280, partial [Candidatus Bathyarchaeia archaeon]|nr:hypothetical protein [Candidatus Bathyarchaeia archaeon]